MNLYQFLKVNNYQGLHQSLIKKHCSQILQALRLMDRYKVIHCDLKPENILVKPCDSQTIKVIDFGSACFCDKRLYTYIQSRFYRAPEIILGLPYSTAIDMWSLGCILVELFTGRPIFPGENEAEQMGCMMEVLGIPSTKLLARATRRSFFFEAEGRPKVVLNSKGKRRVPGMRSLREVMKGAEEGFLHLVEQCLDWDQRKRITPDEALLHPWVQGVEGGEQAPVQRLKHAKTQSEAVFKVNGLFSIKESP